MAEAPWTFRSIEKIRDVVVIHFLGRTDGMTVTIPVQDAQKLSEEIAKLRLGSS